MRQTEILVIGNGFDLAAGYATRYKDFLDFIATSDLVDIIERAQNGEPLREDVARFIRDSRQISLDEVRELRALSGSNAWLFYFRECKADKQGWIDLEREITPVLHAFQWILTSDYNMRTNQHEGKAAFYNYPEGIGRILDLWRRYFHVTDAPILANENWSNPQYGLYKDRIIQDLKDNFAAFKKMLSLSMDVVTQSPPIENAILRSLRADIILNFNYTTTERFFDGLQNAQTFHVHGSVDQPDRIVLGVDGFDDEQNRFIYWTKPFQRILTQQDPGYRESFLISPANMYAVTVFGHSLDPIDAYILCPLLANAGRINIYYHDYEEYEQKMVNLVKLLGHEEVEERVYQQRILLKCTTDTVSST